MRQQLMVDPCLHLSHQQTNVVRSHLFLVNNKLLCQQQTVLTNFALARSARGSMCIYVKCPSPLLQVQPLLLLMPLPLGQSSCSCQTGTPTMAGGACLWTVLFLKTCATHTSEGRKGGQRRCDPPCLHTDTYLYIPQGVC